MPEFRADEWRPVQGECYVETSPRHFLDIQVSCTKEVRVFGVCEEKKTLLKSGTEFRFRGQVKGFEKVLIQGTGETPFGARVLDCPMQDGEYNSGVKAPVIELPEASNLVLKMRQIARAHHQATRSPVLEPEDFISFGRYEFEDDQEVLFEEEALEKAEAETKAKAKARKEAAAKAAQEAQEKPQEPQQAPKAVPPAPTAEAAE